MEDDAKQNTLTGQLLARGFSSSSVIRGFTMAQRAFSHSETLFSIKFFVQVKYQAANALLFRLQQARGVRLTCVLIIVSTVGILIIS